MSEVTDLTVDPSNAEQSEAWDGDEGAYWAENAERFDRAVAAYHHGFMAAAGIGTSDRVLDIACGAGQTTRDAGRAASVGSAFGVDLSTRMIDYARQAAAREGVANVRFERADAQVHPFKAGTYDVAISRTGAMFFGDPVVAFANIARAMRPGGRLVLLTWQGPDGNEWIRELSGAMAAGRDLPAPPVDAPGPFSLANPERVRAILGRAGFTNVELEGRTEPMWFGDETDDAQRFVLGLLGWMLHGADDHVRRSAVEAVTATLSAHESRDGVLYGSAAWTIRATRP